MCGDFRGPFPRWPGTCRRRRRHARCCLQGLPSVPGPAHNVEEVIFDALEKWLQLRAATLDSFEIGLPLARHGRALHVGVHNLNKVETLLRRFETLAVSDDVTPLEQDFDDSGAGLRSA